MSTRAALWAIRFSGCDVPGMRLVLCELAAFADADGVAWPSVPTMAAELGMSERNVRRTLRRLEDAGLVAYIGDAGALGLAPANRAPAVWQLSVPDDLLHGDLKKSTRAHADFVKSAQTLGLRPIRGDTSVRGDTTVTPSARGDIQGISGVTSRVARGDIAGSSGVTPVSPKRTIERNRERNIESIPPKAPHGGGASEPGEEGDQMFTMNGGEQVVTMSDGMCYSVRPGRCTARQVTEHLDGLADPQACPVCAYSPANRLTHGQHADDIALEPLERELFENTTEPTHCGGSTQEDTKR